MSSNLTDHLYTGHWINHSKGAVLGSTITLSQRNGAILLSFLGIFVTLVATQLWRIVSFVIHQARVGEDRKDGLHYQQQNVLRNAVTPASASWHFFLLTVAWWRHIKRPALRTLPWVLLAVMYMALLGAAGIFSSEVSKAAGKDRLILGGLCGHSYPLNPSEDELSYHRTKVNRDAQQGLTYSKSCYHGSHDPLYCQTFVKDEIQYTSNQNATCPFGGDICEISNTTAYELDTGPLDSHETFGINSLPQHRVTFRMRSTCTPLKTEGYANETANKKGDMVTYYNYGRLIDLGNNQTIQNSTFSYRRDMISDYYETVTWGAEKGGSNMWLPVPELKLPEADTTITAVKSGHILYYTPNNDPVFGTDTDPIPGNSDLRPAYRSSTRFKAIACAHQYELCNPETGKCSGLVPLDNLLGSDRFLAEGVQSASSSTELGLSLAQKAVASRILIPLKTGGMFYTIYGLGNNALRAQESIFMALQQRPLPDNQWMIEVSSWFSIVLATLQRNIVEYATNPMAPDDSYIILPPDEFHKAMCGMQKVSYAGNTSSFSVLGLSLILVIGFLIIVTAPFLDVWVGSIQRRLGVGEHARVNWALDDKLQLQRTAFEQLGKVRWHTGLYGVPVALAGDKFTGLDDAVAYSKINQPAGKEDEELAQLHSSTARI